MKFERLETYKRSAELNNGSFAIVFYKKLSKTRLFKLKHIGKETFEYDSMVVYYVKDYEY